jgi:glutamate--cysteine ligase
MARFRCAYGKTSNYLSSSQRQILSKGFDKRLSALSAISENTLAGGLKGIEKESLRIDKDGYLSKRPHPLSLGSALTNRYITTDFSEALLEFVTPAFANTWETLHLVCDIHQFSYEQLGDELLWVASMPCRLPSDPEIPIADYGTSNVGQMKTIYRKGLGHRYGRQMQTIAGVHFNYSLPKSIWPVLYQIVGASGSEDDFRSEQYLSLIRNFRRFGWIVLYLFGASPALCKSFGDNSALQMPSLNAETAYEPFGTSLRMSDLGYSNQNQARLNISLNSLDEYIHDLNNATRLSAPDYEKIGIKVDGEYRQLNANHLQIENEYYSSVRPKRVAMSGERPTTALHRGGIEYVEIRSLDINIFDPCGINQNTMRFVEALLIYCLLEDSPLLDKASTAEAARNQAQTAKQGRDPESRLTRGGSEISVPDWANEILTKVSSVAELIDRDSGTDSYAKSVQHMRSLVEDPALTPSARMLQELQDADCSFFELALNFARSHRDYFASIEPLQEKAAENFGREVTSSIERQREIETADDVSLDEYLSSYFSGE